MGKVSKKDLQETIAAKLEAEEKLTATAAT